MCFVTNCRELEYDILASRLRDKLIQDPSSFDAERLQAISAAELADWFHGSDLPNIDERVEKLQELGQVLLTHFDGQAFNVLRKAEQSARRLVELVVSHFPGFQDHSVYHGRQVFFYKRAQILVSQQKPCGPA